MKKCKTCDYFDGTKFYLEGGIEVEPVNKYMGVCRFSPPVPGDAPWANVSENDWCGKHDCTQFNEARIRERLAKKPASTDEL